MANNQDTADMYESFMQFFACTACTLLHCKGQNSGKHALIGKIVSFALLIKDVTTRKVRLLFVSFDTSWLTLFCKVLKWSECSWGFFSYIIITPLHISSVMNIDWKRVANFTCQLAT